MEQVIVKIEIKDQEPVIIANYKDLVEKFVRGGNALYCAYSIDNELLFYNYCKLNFLKTLKKHNLKLGGTYVASN